MQRRDIRYPESKQISTNLPFVLYNTSAVHTYKLMLAAFKISMTDRLFVYGTLKPGGPNEHVLAEVPGTWEPATVKGTLLQEGWGAAVGYPGIVLHELGGEVHGFIFSSEELATHWARLDEFEGDGYERVVTSAELGEGTVVKAHIYVLNGNSSTKIPMGIGY